MTSSTLIAYHAAHYTPNNMVLAVSGDVTFEEVMALATRKLEDVPAFEQRPRPVFRHTGGETVHLPYSGEDMKGWICFPGISRNDPDHAAVNIMSHILNHRFNDEIQENRKIACSTTVGHMNHADADGFVAGTFGSPETIAQALPVLFQEIRNIQKSVRPEEIALARDSLRMEFVQGLEKPEDMCMAIGSHMIVSGTMFDPQAELRASAKVTAQDVQRVARRIFSGLPSMTFMGATLPLPTPQEIRAMVRTHPQNPCALPAPGLRPCM
ncbi:MAG TPA: hypothetical protein DCW68_00270 [Rhodospirillaceae bacterium]|nr:MAG: hypothetical protein A2018_01585 [Alphaproteobacteria bacterium GWF2_58_20]HAU28535.1 hypothetical protein [Rhodospirillaceae bacterium]